MYLIINNIYVIEILKLISLMKNDYNLIFFFLI